MNSTVRTWLTRSAVAGLVAGTLDIGAAALIYLVSPLMILHGIASGALGKSALAEGARYAAIGLLLQWGMSIFIAGISLGISSTWRPLREHWVLSGIAYGTVTFAVMNYVVMPLSAVGHAPHFTPLHFVENLIAMFVFGLIVSSFARSAGEER
jgi:hypothetical protein